MSLGLHFLYKVLKEKRADLLIKIPKKWFITDEEKKEYRRIREFLKRFQHLPSLPDVVPVGYEDQPLEFYIEELRKRYVKGLFAKIKSLEIGDENLEKILQWFSREVNELTSEKYAEYIVRSDELISFAKKVTDHLRKSKVIGLLGYPSGYYLIDIHTGGYIPGDVFVYVARMKAGKTMYLLNSVLKLAKEYKCLFISMEMPLQSIMKRLLALELKISNFTDQRRIVSSFVDKKFEELNLNLDLVNGAYLSGIYDLYALTSFYRPEIVFIDGAYLLDTATYKSEWEKAKKVAEELRRYALKTGVALVYTWQLNRESVKSMKKTGEIEPEFIAYTDAVAQCATAIVGILSSEIPNKKKFLIIVNREGKSGIAIDVNWDWERMDFNEDKNSVIIEEPILEDFVGEMPFDNIESLVMEDIEDAS